MQEAAPASLTSIWNNFIELRWKISAGDKGFFLGSFMLSLRGVDALRAGLERGLQHRRPALPPADAGRLRGDEGRGAAARRARARGRGAADAPM